jgi:integrase
METYVIPRIGGLRLEAITPSDLTKMYKGLLTAGSRTGKGLAPKTVRHVHTTLRRALADAVDAKYLTWNPAAHAKAPKVPRNKKPSAWTAQQVRSFLGHVEGDRLEALWILAATSGMRRGELLGLRWRDVDLDAGELHIRRTQVSYGKLRVEKEPKTARSERPLPLPPSTVEALRAHHRRQSTEKLRAGAAYTDDGFVFCDEIGLPLIPANVSTAFGRHVKAAGLPRLTLHGLRHSYATVALEAGVDVLYVSELLGHASVSITMDVYQHSRPERLEAAANAIADAIGG